MQRDRLRVSVLPHRSAMGEAAAEEAARYLREVLSQKDSARVVFASAPSQDELLESLTSATGIDWNRIAAFQMDEFVGLPPGHSATFRTYLQERLLSRVAPGVFHAIRGDSRDLDAECERYAALLGEAPIDLVCMGIGENGHIGLNDPEMADFSDPVRVKVVELDEECRKQQVIDGLFPEAGAVPTRAITLTCTALMSAGRVICVAPGPRKAAAVCTTLLASSVSEATPASILRRHPRASLYLDPQSYRLTEYLK